MAIYLRRANKKDIADIMIIINQAKDFLKSNKSPQWQNGYPNEQSFLDDITKKECWVLIINDKVSGVAALTFERQANYDDISEGTWRYPDKNYVAIHRIAIGKNYRGKHLSQYMMSNLITMAYEQGYKQIRVDTHELNQSMQALLEKCDFERRGIIYVDEKNDPRRIAYELNL